MDEMKNKLKSIVKELMADLPPIPAHKATEVPAVAAMDQMMAQVNNMTLDQLYTLGKQISANFPGFNPSFRGLSPEETEEKLRLEIKRFMDKHKSIAPKIFNFDGNTITLKAMQFKENKMKVNQLKQIIREEISKVLNEQTNRIGWDKGFQTSIEFNADLAQLLAPYLERGTIAKDELEMAADQAGY